MDRLRIWRLVQSPLANLPLRPRTPDSLFPFRSFQALSPYQSRISPFSSTTCLQKRKRQAKKVDSRVRNIKYHLAHPITPRPLRFSRHRYLRHWTIHRAWHTHLRNTRRARELDLERQYESMREACEALRTLGEDGIGYTIAQAPTPNEDGSVAQAGEEEPGLVVMGGSGKSESGKEMGRLYRLAMEKKGIWQGVPIEYARIQTDSPGRDGWDHGWKR